ncbi:MAG: hypothetical protein RSE47_01025 [Acidaminococcaceae bacterium]
MMTLTEKYEHLKTSVGNNKRLAVAFSGGVDSSLLLAVARDVLNQEVVGARACTSVGRAALLLAGTGFSGGRGSG